MYACSVYIYVIYTCGNTRTTCISGVDHTHMHTLPDKPEFKVTAISRRKKTSIIQSKGRVGFGVQAGSSQPNISVLVY